MCGISGTISIANKGTRISADTLLKMNNSMEHRGPDGDGILLGGTYTDLKSEIKAKSPDSHLFDSPISADFVFAHRRLSIIDLAENAFQPMADVWGKYWITFNGEVYNHAEIRAELEALGHTFKTDHSDTEVIVTAWKQWGETSIEKLRGMFAFAIADIAAKDFYIVRDRIGIKPLYYTMQGGNLQFASEIKALIANPAFDRQLNHAAFGHYLTFLCAPAPETFFKNVQKLPAGHMMKITAEGDVSIKEYWDVFSNQQDLSAKSQREIEEQIVEELQEAVRLRMIADVPVGVFLSGGIDSTLNAKLFSDLTDKPVKAFSIGYENDDQLSRYTNEFKYAKKAADLYNCDYYEQSLNQQHLFDFLPTLVHHQDEPIGDPVCMPIYYVSKLARDNGVVVCQVGEGSDELFHGYPFWKDIHGLQTQNDRWPIPNGLKKLAVGGLQAAGRGYDYPVELLDRASQNLPVFWTGLKAMNEWEKGKLLQGTVKSDAANFASADIIQGHYQNFKQRAPEPNWANWMSYIDLKIRLPELLLMRVDKMAMAVSLEARVPFLDHKFVEFSMSISTAMKKQGNETKYLLKKAVENQLPHDIIYRKKQGFDAPVHDWFQEKFGRVSQQEINKFNDERGYFDKKELQKLYDRGEGRKVWYLYNFVNWANHWSV